MRKTYRRTPKNYDGNQVTTHQMTDLLSNVLNGISENYQDRPDMIIASWPQLIGAKLAPMTHAHAFRNGVLHIKVKNSTLYSLLARNEKKRLLHLLRERFPEVEIKNIQFRIG